MAKSHGLEIARGILEKYGWKEGEGLGRNGCGMVEALRPKLKFNTAGIGYSQVEKDQLTSCWWEKAYNAAAKELSITEGKSGVRVKSGSAKVRSSFPLKSYDSEPFVKARVLTNSGTVPVIEESKKVQIEFATEEAHSSVLTDEALFEACGKRTVHKGARHGLKLNGKLARLARQEQLVARGLRGEENNCILPEGSKSIVNIATNESSLSKKMKKRKNDSSDTLNMYLGTNSIPSTSKQKGKCLELSTDTFLKGTSIIKSKINSNLRKSDSLKSKKHRNEDQKLTSEILFEVKNTVTKSKILRKSNSR